MNGKPSYEELEKIIDDLKENIASKEKESEMKFRLIADYTHNWEYWIGPDSKLLYISPSCKNHTGYSQEDFMENENLFLDIIHPDDKAFISEHLEHGITEPAVESIEFRIIDQLGKVRWISHSCQPLFDENQEYLGRRASNCDITEQKQAEKDRDELTANLKKTSSLLNTVFDAIPDVIGVQELNHKIIRYNRAGYRFLDMKPSDVHGKRCYELIGNEVPCHICATTEVYETKQPAQAEKYVEEINKWLDVRAYPVFDEDGNLSRIIEHLRDISKEKNAEIKLIEAQERLITILNSIDAHIYVADLETYEILFMNNKMIEDFGTNFTGEKCHQSFRNESTPCKHCTNSKILDQNQQPTGVHIWQGKNPITSRWYMNCDRAINWVDGRIVRIQIAMDITATKAHEKDRKRMEQQLLQAQKLEAVGTLAGGIAHDFNNLLMGIQGRASLMSYDLEPNHNCHEHVNAILEYSRSATDLTSQLLGVSKGGKYEVKPTNINDVVSESSVMFGRTKKEISIHLKLHESTPISLVDRRQIEQVLLNIFINAWQAMPGGGKIFIETALLNLVEAYCKPYSAQPGQYVNIAITDTGIGMDEQTRQRVFDPFFTTRRKERGTGLGLASAYGIVNNHSGIITVDSEIGKGATFKIYLPLTDQQEQSEPDAAKSLLKGTETLLLVDDEQLVIDVGKEMLEKLGYQVITANNGKQASEVIENYDGNIDLMILDMIMPGMDGNDTFDHVRKIRPALPVILSSGYSINGKATEIMNKGCNGFIQKPFELSALSQKIRQILDE